MAKSQLKPLPVRLPPELLKALRKQARKEKVSMAEIIRLALKNYL
jgi:hypothetical protein